MSGSSRPKSLKRLASEILADKDAPPVLLLAAWKLIYHGDKKPLADLVELAGV